MRWPRWSLTMPGASASWVQEAGGADVGHVAINQPNTMGKPLPRWRVSKTHSGHKQYFSIFVIIYLLWSCCSWLVSIFIQPISLMQPFPHHFLCLGNCSLHMAALDDLVDAWDASAPLREQMRTSKRLFLAEIGKSKPVATITCAAVNYEALKPLAERLETEPGVIGMHKVPDLLKKNLTFCFGFFSPVKLSLLLLLTVDFDMFVFLDWPQPSKPGSGMFCWLPWHSRPPVSNLGSESSTEGSRSHAPTERTWRQRQRQLRRSWSCWRGSFSGSKFAGTQSSGLWCQWCSKIMAHRSWEKRWDLKLEAFGNYLFLL